MEDFKENRAFVAVLIRKVLIGALTVGEAVRNFPFDTGDKSLEAAYHALVHREADEDLRRRDLNYRDAQDSYLEQLAQTLEQGKELPKNIIKNYNQYYRDIQINQTDFMKKLVKRLCKFMNV